MLLNIKAKITLGTRFLDLYIFVYKSIHIYRHRYIDMLIFAGARKEI